MVRLVSCVVYALCVYVCVAGKDGVMKDLKEQNFDKIIKKFDKSDPFYPQSLSVALITFGSKMCNGALIQAPKGDKVGHYVLTAASCFWNRNLHGYRTRSGDKRYHVSGGWKVTDVAKVKVQFGVTESSNVAECGVADIRISEQWMLNTYIGTMNSDRENDFAVVVLKANSPKCQLDSFVPFDAAGKVGFFHGVTKPKVLIRAAYTPEKQLVAHLEKKTDGYPWLLRTVAQGETQTPAKSEIGAPVWTAAHAKDKDQLYAMYVMHYSDAPGVHLSLKFNGGVGGRLDGYMWREHGLSPLFELLDVCSETTKDTEMCWGTCATNRRFPCWRSNTKKRGGSASRPCGENKIQTLCGTAKPAKPKKAVKPANDATSKMFGAKLGDAYDSYYMYSDQDQEIDDEDGDEELEQELDEELDEMMQEMFTAGYNKGAKQQYRYQN